ncbi:MAG: C-GCAxxG-C-C family protein [Butyrivibrio sp.]
MDNIQSRANKADMLHCKGYNCAQAVACAFADVMNLDEKIIFKMLEGNGLGMSDTYGTCGAVSGMAAVIAYTNSTGNLEAPDSKASTYEIVRNLEAVFRKNNGSTICRELKGMDTGKVLRPCPDCIKDAATILESYFAQKEL